MTYSPRWVLNGLDLTSAPFGVMQDDADPGTAETVSAILASMIADGDIELTQRRGNRTYALPVVIEGTDRSTIATAQADLARAVEQAMGTLEFDPGDGSDVTVFETFAGSVALSNGIDDASAQNGMQRCTLTIPCRPFVRPADLVVIPAPPLPASGGTPIPDVVIDAAGTATPASGAWSIESGGTLVTAINMRGGRYNGLSAALNWSGSVNVAAQRYLVVTGQNAVAAKYVGNYTPASAQWRVNSVARQPVSYTPSGNRFTAIFDISDVTTLTGLRLWISMPSNLGVTQTTLYADTVTATNGPQPGVFTGKVQSRQVPIYGSQRTELSELTVTGRDSSGAALPLGEQVLIHTASAGSDGRSKFLGIRAASAVAGDTADTDAVSGVKNALGTTSAPTLFPFPASALLPGEYELFPRLKGTAGVRTISYRAMLDGTGSLDAYDPATGWYTEQVTVAAGYGIYPLGALMLPPADIEDDSANIVIYLASDTSVDFDEMWIAHRESGQVTLLRTSDSGGISEVRINGATVDSPVPAVWVGTAAGALIAAGPRIQAFDPPTADAGLLQISTVTPTCATSQIEVGYFPHYAHDVAPLPAGAA